MEFTECHFLDTGYCLTPEFAVLQGGRWRITRCRCLAALMRHPTEGWGLWDTGYAPRFLDATRRLPYRLYRWATPFPRQADRSVVSQLAEKELTTADIQWIVLSHLHGDHIAGVRDFPSARLICTREAFDHASRLKGIVAVRKAFVPALLPTDFESRSLFIDRFDGPCLGALGRSFDLFGDGSALLFPLPGHARGQMGMLAKTAAGTKLMAADSAMHRVSIREGRPPGSLTRLIADQPDQVLPTIQNLRAFTRDHPEIRVYPTHCPEAYREVIEEGSALCLPITV